MRKMMFDVNYEAIKGIADAYDIDITDYDNEQLVKGYQVELEHETSNKNNKVDAVKNIADPLRIAINHLDEIPDYYDRLEKMEKGAGVDLHEYFLGNSNLIK